MIGSVNNDKLLVAFFVWHTISAPCICGCYETLFWFWRQFLKTRSTIVTMKIVRFNKTRDVLVSVCVHILVFHFQKTFTGHRSQLWFQYIRFCFLLFFVAFWQNKSNFAKRVISQNDLSCYVLQHRKYFFLN